MSGVSAAISYLGLEPCLPFFLGRPVSDGIFVEFHFAEFGAEVDHFGAVRVIVGEEPFFEKQELMFWSGGVVGVPELLSHFCSSMARLI